MNKEWEPEKDRLVKFSGYDCVAVHHGHLDHLIGSLMHVCELSGDKEQRDALKSEIKCRCRDWLNDQYASAGYDESCPAEVKREGKAPFPIVTD